MNCKHCFCIPFYHGNYFIENFKRDYQCCKCAKAKYGLTKEEKRELKSYVKRNLTTKELDVK